MNGASPEAFAVTLSQDRSLAGATLGDGEAVVFIHGALVDHWDWVGDPIAALGPSHRLVLVDRPGYGGSRRPRYHGRPDQQARQIWEGLGKAGWTPTYLVGHSFGAMVALAYAAAFPDQVRGLLLLAPIAFPEARPEQALFGPRAAPLVGPLLAEIGRSTGDPFLLRGLQSAMFAPQQPPREWLQRYSPERTLAAGRTVQEGEDANALLPAIGAGVRLDRIRADVEIICGGADRVAPRERHAEPLQARLGGSELIVLDGVGHMLHHVRPEAVAEGVQRLLARGG